jgi:uncharacterized membrane protein required for colicin V production
MAWTDIVAGLLILGIAWLESHRGFGRSLFDLLGAIISLKLADLLSHPLARIAPVVEVPAESQAFYFAALFVAMAALTVIATKLIYDSILLSLDVLDPLVGAFLGIFSGSVVAHILLKTLLLSYGDTEAATLLLNSFMGQELLKFRTYHIVLTALQNLGNW